MGLFTFDIGEKAETVALFIGSVRSELQRALAYEKTARKLTQQQLAKLIGVNRSVINRQIMGYENLTIKRVAELAWALGWEIEFSLNKKGEAKAVMPARATTLSGTQQPPKLADKGQMMASSTCNDNNGCCVMEPTGVTLFCDDIRFERSQKITFVGAYGPEMLIAGKLPALLPNLGFYVQIRLPPEAPAPSQINIFMPDAKEGNEPSITVEIGAPAENEISKAKNTAPGTTALLATNIPILLGPTLINSEGLIRVRVVCGETIIKAGTLKITRVDALPNA